VDRGDAGGGGERARVVGVPGFDVALRIRWRRGRLPQGECRRGRAIALEVRVVAPATGNDVAEGDTRIDEGALARLRVQRVDGCEQRRPRTEVVRQRRRFDRVAARGEVGVHVAAAETVDRLLGIADQKQCRLGTAAAEHAVEDLPLAHVGVLELVHQRHRVLRAQVARQRIATWTIERIGDAIDQVVVRLHPALPLEHGQARARVVAHAVQ